MSIPAFDRFGNVPVGNLFPKPGEPLPTGLIRVTLSDFHSRFVAGVKNSKTRADIWDGWQRHRMDLEKIGIRFATLIGGSYTSSKIDPGDIDLCIIFDSEDVGSLNAADLAAFGKLMLNSHTKPTYRCDVFPLRLYPLANLRFGSTARDWNYWSRVYGFDRNGRPRAMFLVI